MKKRFFSWMVLFIVFTINAQSVDSSYYYYKEQKIPLTVDKTYVCIVTATNFQKSASAHYGFNDFNLRKLENGTAQAQ
ncbi:MAG: hypothetical protein V4581_08435, partial [Bacteroidota bacterium]